MSSCLTDVQYRSIEAGSSLEARNKLTSENARGGGLSNARGTQEAEDGTKRTHLFLRHATRFFRKSLSVCLTLLIWLTLADFLFQFAHVHRDGRSLAGGVHAAVSMVQAPLERVIGFDARYQFPISNVDFMPLIIFVVLLVLRNRADSLLAEAERLIRGEKKKSLPVYRSHSTNPSNLGLNNPLQKARKPGGDDHLSLRTKIIAIYSE